MYVYRGILRRQSNNVNNVLLGNDGDDLCF